MIRYRLGAQNDNYNLHNMLKDIQYTIHRGAQSLVTSSLVGNDFTTSNSLLAFNPWPLSSSSESLSARLQCLSQKALSRWVLAKGQQESREPTGHHKDGYNEDGCTGVSALETAKGVD